MVVIFKRYNVFVLKTKWVRQTRIDEKRLCNTVWLCFIHLGLRFTFCLTNNKIFTETQIYAGMIRQVLKF